MLHSTRYLRSLESWVTNKYIIGELITDTKTGHSFLGAHFDLPLTPPSTPDIFFLQKLSHPGYQFPKMTLKLYLSNRKQNSLGGFSFTKPTKFGLQRIRNSLMNFLEAKKKKDYAESGV